MEHKLDPHFFSQSLGFTVKGKLHFYPVTTIAKNGNSHIVASFTSGYIEVPHPDKDNKELIYLGSAWRFVITEIKDGTRTDLEVFYTNGNTNHFFDRLKKSRASLTAIEERLKAAKAKYRRGENSVNYFEYTDKVVDFLIKERLQFDRQYRHCAELKGKGFYPPKSKRVVYALVPPGTIVWSSDMFKGGHAIQHTVKHIRANGIDSYVLEMEEFDSRSPLDSYFNSRRNVCFNLSFVDKIIFRPSGKKAFIEENEDTGRISTDVTKRNYVNIGSYEFSKFVNSIVNADSIVDFEKLNTFLKNQEFVKRVASENGYCYDFFGKKKKVRRWLKQNVNRFLITKKKAKEEEDSLYESLYNDDF